MLYVSNNFEVPCSKYCLPFISQNEKLKAILLIE